MADLQHPNELSEAFIEAGGTVDANEEVILPAGAINSPQLLMLSDIGPAEQLATHDSSIVDDLPGFGKNLQDHLQVKINCACEKSITLEGADSLGNVLTYLLLKRGPLTSNVAEAGGFTSVSKGTERPDIQFHFGLSYSVTHRFDNPEGHGFWLGALCLRPENHGKITLQSGDPVIDHQPKHRRPDDQGC